MKNKNCRQLLDKDTIKAIKNNEAEAMYIFYEHYEKLINTYCTKVVCNDKGDVCYFIDEDKSQEIKKGLFIAVKKFKF